MDILKEYNKLKELKNDSNYPFNLINSLKHDILETKKQIDLEYIKDYKKNSKSGGSIQKEILIYMY